MVKFVIRPNKFCSFSELRLVVIHNMHVVMYNYNMYVNNVFYNVFHYIRKAVISYSIC